MLDSVRKNMKTKNVIGWSLLIIICGVFVFFGLPQQFGVPGAGSVATVNGELISVADLQSEEERLSQVFANFMGGSGDTGAQRQMVRQQALQNLITLELISQAAREQGVWSSDAEIRDYIVKDIPIFQEDGIFRRDRYRQYLQAVRSTPKEFEGRLRKDRQNLRVRRLIEASVAPLDIEVEKQTTLRNQQINVEFVQLDQSLLADQQNIDQARAEEALQNEDFLGRAKDYYEVNKGEFTEPEQVKAQHILIKPTTPEEGSAGQDVQAKVAKVQEELKTKDFSEVAREYSDDPASKEAGGDLGYFEKGRMTPEFEEAAFALEPGKVSEPIQTQFGTHIIKVTDHKEAVTKDFEDVRVQIGQKLIAEEKVEENLAALEKALSENQMTEATEYLQNLGVSWQETGLFPLSSERIPKLGSSPELSRAVFGLEEVGAISADLIRDGSKRYIVRLKAKEEKTDAPKGEVLEQQVARDRSYAIYQSWIENIRKDAEISVNDALLSSGALPN